MTRSANASLPAPPARVWDGLTIAVLAVCLAGTLLLGLLSDGVHHDDDLTHFLMARWARWFPGYLLHIWGRPGLTVPLSAVAWIGDPETAWHACRILSALVTATGAWISARLAMRLGVRRPWLVIVAFYAQPLNALLAGTTLTENFAGLYLISAVLLLERGRAMLASAVFSLVLVTRHEAVVLLPLWWVALAARSAPTARVWLSAGLALWAVVVHNVAFWLVFQNWPMAVFLTPSGSTEYLARGPLAYLPRALEAIPPVIAALALIGGAVCVRRRKRLIPAMAAVFFLTHCAVVALGVFASGGYARFVVTIAPLIAVLAVVGWEEVWRRWRGGHTTRGAWLTMTAVWLVGATALAVESRAGRGVAGAALGWWIAVTTLGVLVATLGMAFGRPRRHALPGRVAVAVLVLTVVIQIGWIVRPMRRRSDQAAVADVVAWLRRSGLEQRPIFATHPWMSYDLDLIENPSVHKGPRLVAAMPVGTVVVWDSHYSASDYHGLPLRDLRRDDHYRFLRSFEGIGPQPIELVVFEKAAATPMPTQAHRTFPPDPAAGRVRAGMSYYIRASDAG